MPDRHSLPSGAWIELRDWRELRRGDKQNILGDVADPEKLMAMMFEVTNGLLRLLITNWSYELPIPSVSRQSLDLLPMEDDGALTQLVQPAFRALFPQTPVADDEQRADESSPTEPSAG
jgi:hypothetical protein